MVATSLRPTSSVTERSLPAVPRLCFHSRTPCCLPNENTSSSLRLCTESSLGDVEAEVGGWWDDSAHRCEARKAMIELLFVGREKNLCELTRAEPSGDDKDDRHCGMAMRWT